jgi:hypothetical protein
VASRRLRHRNASQEAVEATWRVAPPTVQTGQRLPVAFLVVVQEIVFPIGIQTVRRASGFEILLSTNEFLRKQRLCFRIT